MIESPSDARKDPEREPGPPAASSGSDTAAAGTGAAGSERELVGLEEIRAARERIAEDVLLTPCLHSPVFSERTGTDLYIKHEGLQRTGSFKARGALNTLLTMRPDEREAGVIAASAGNHAQGVAYAASRVGVRSVIVMPETTPLVKISRTEELGGEVELVGSSYDEAYDHAASRCREEGLTFLHPFDDERVIAGQGTLGLELTEQVEGLEAVVVPIGGGGLVSGVAAAVKAVDPSIRVLGVQSEQAPAMKRSFDEGRLVHVESRRSLADGITVKRPGQITFRHIRELVDDIEVVSEIEIAGAVFDLLERGKVLAEGAGAAGMAALTAGRFPQLRGLRTAVVLGGSNIDLDMLERIVDRSRILGGRLVRLRLTIQDRPGALADLLEVTAGIGVNVLRVHHSRVFTHTTFWEAEVELTLETRDRDQIEQLKEALYEAGYARVEEV